MKFYGKFLLIIIVTILFYASFLFFSDIQKLENKIINFDIRYVPLIIFLVTCAWILLYLRWHLLLKNTGEHVSFRGNLSIYVSGFALSITPGKIGELIRTELLKKKFNIPRTKTVPLIFVEKLYDLTGAMTIAIIGIWFFHESRYIIIAGLILLVSIFILISSDKIFNKSLNYFNRFKIMTKFIQPLSQSYEIIKISTRGKNAITALLLSISYWLITSLAVYFILIAFNITNIEYLNVVSTFTASLFLGAVSFIPGGIGVAEGSLVSLFHLQGIEVTTAIVLVVMIRLLTLWYGVTIGFIALKLTGGFSLKL